MSSASAGLISSLSRRLGLLLGATLIAGLVASCSFGLPSAETDRLQVSDTPLDLVDIQDANAYSPRSLGTRDLASRATVTSKYGFTLVATLQSPTYGSETLQASHVALEESGKYAYVSYMLRGAPRHGRLDVVDVSKPSAPVLVDTMDFPDTDLAVVYQHDNKIYLGGQKVDPSGSGNNALVMAFRLDSNGSISLSSKVERQLPGAFATDIAISTGSVLYVSTGAYSTGVGVYALDPSTLLDSAKISPVTGYPDLRSLDWSSSSLVVLAAQSPAESPSQPCQVLFFDGKLGSPTASFSLAPLTVQAEAKSKLTWYEKKAFVALNLSGVAIVDAEKGLSATIPAPSLAGISADRQSSNSVSIGTGGSHELVFIANGEAGLWVGELDSLFAQDGGAEKSSSNILGAIRFGAGESVNFAACKNNVCVVADGIGGIRFLLASASD